MNRAVPACFEGGGNCSARAALAAGRPRRRGDRPGAPYTRNGARRATIQASITPAPMP